MLNKQAHVSKRLIIAVAAVFMAVAVTIPARPARADTGTVTQVEYNVSAHILGVKISSTGTLYLAQTVSPGCGISVNADELKMIQSIAQASYLSGRSVSIGSAVCNAQTYITDIALM
jgi:hypothetical protein